MRVCVEVGASGCACKGECVCLSVWLVDLCLRSRLVELFVFRTMRSRDHEVVLVRRTINLGCWEFGMGREWGGDGKGEVSLQVTWGQGGRDPIRPRRVSK